MNSKEINEIIKKVHIVESTLKTDVIPAMNRQSPEGGYHSTIRLIFSYTDFFGAIYLNEVSGKSAVEFIRRYFGKINPRYSDIAGLLYTTFRHGTIHTIHPKKIKINGITFLWLIGKDLDLLYQNDKSIFVWKKMEKGDDGVYIHLMPKAPMKRSLSKKYKSVFMFPISLEQLCEDLKSAIREYKNDLKFDLKLQNNAQEMLRKIDEPSKFSLSNNKVIEFVPSLNQSKPRSEILPSELKKIFI